MSQQVLDTTSPVGDHAPAGTIYQDDIVRSRAAHIVLAFGRVSLGWYFMWAFVDKMFGLGFATTAERA